MMINLTTHLRRVLLRLAVLALFCAWPVGVRAAAGDTWVDVNLTSVHSESRYVWEGLRRSYNRENLGLGLSHEMNDWFELKVGFFNNSYRKTSLYGVAALKRTVLSRGPWETAPGLMAGLVSGYEDTPEQTGEITPWAMVTMTVTYQGRWRATLGYLPSRLFRSRGVDLVTLQVGMRL